MLKVEGWILNSGISYSPIVLLSLSRKSPDYLFYFCMIFKIYTFDYHVYS
jgi:hypothetical protein